MSTFYSQNMVCVFFLSAQIQYAAGRKTHGHWLMAGFVICTLIMMGNHAAGINMPQPQGLPPGVYPNLSMEAYHLDPAIGSSGIKNLLSSPMRYWFNSRLNPNWKPKADTKAMLIGKAYHAKILEPEKYNDYVVVMPEKWPTKKECGVAIEEQKEIFRENNSHRIIITQADSDLIEDMYYALQSQRPHLKALSTGIPECSIFWHDQETGLMCKIRVDRFAPTWITDLKSTMSIDDKNLRHEYPKRGYDISGAMYSIGMQELKKSIKEGYQMPDVFSPEFVKEFVSTPKQHFAFVWQEKEAPHITRLWRQTPYTNEIGYDKFRKGLYVYHEHKDTVEAWPSGYPVVEDIEETMVSATINY